MSNGVYGTKRGADVDISDIEIFMHYTPDRNTQNSEIVKLNTSDVIIPNTNPNSPNGNEFIGGMYTLKLPKDQFSAKGFYTLLIRPLEIRTRITDVGLLSANSNIRGLVFDINSLEEELRGKFENGSLTGYRIEYLNNGNTQAKVNNLFRIITSNNRCEPVNQNISDSASKAIRYRFNDNGTLTFCTVTPNSSGSARPNVIPFIGGVNQNVIITNTYFDPVMIEIEMVEYDTNDLAIGLFGNMTKSIEDGIVTMYDFENAIYKQYNVYEIKEEITDQPLHEVKELMPNIDEEKSFDNITDLDG